MSAEIRKNGLSLKTTLKLAFGFACMIAYSRMLSQGFVGYLTQGGAAIADPFYAVRLVAEVAALLILAIGGYLRKFSVTTGVFFVCTAVMTAATIVVAATDDLGSAGAPFFFAAGAANAVVMYVWMLLLSRFPVRQIMASTLIGLAIAGAIIEGSPLLGEETCLVVAVLCAFSAGSLALSLDPRLESSKADGMPPGVLPRIPWFSVLLILANGILGAMLYTIANRRLSLVTDGANYAVFAVGAALTIGAVALIMLKRRDWVHIVWVPPFVLLSVAIVFSCFVSDASAQAFLGFLLAAVFCFRFLYWMVFPSMFSLLKVPRAFLAGLLLIAVNGSLANFVGANIGALLPMNIQVISNAGCVIAAVSALVLAGAMTLNREVNLRPYEMEDEDDAPLPAGASHPTVEAAPQEPALAQQEAQRAGGLDAVSQGEPEKGRDQAKADEPSAGAPAADAARPEAVEDPRKEDAQQTITDQLKQRVDLVSERYGLTARESEVALLTAQGFSCAYISGKLIVSNSTVRYHQQNAYRKLGVHSRNELIEFVNRVNGD
ncbi:MAG: LuxR C-terminal-related transcriptional regulator [Berryella intestinalis]|uniref:helix-turn-helix transcriptional regulator n=1 Tax=Berryella intestinalis TaxID=1531429 RepID=UPI002A74D901|nr:LuxR C-terminal-related transcriptional regulator [Berryella intestinalis]MDY3129344.1 LuxR C-terminal-related transcriptional regulator [Berryella intestinalis]